eukprot:7382981-Prymnesium_polylepis.1
MECCICLTAPPRRGRSAVASGVYCCAGHLTCETCLSSAVTAAAEALADTNDLIAKAAAAETKDPRRHAVLAGNYCCAV